MYVLAKEDDVVFEEYFERINQRLSLEVRYLNRKVHSFYRFQKNKTPSREEKTLSELIEEDPYIDKYFINKKNKLVKEANLKKHPLLVGVSKKYEEIRTHLKSLDSKNRFYILETIDFFKSQTSIIDFVEILILRKNNKALQYTAYQLIKKYCDYFEALALMKRNGITDEAQSDQIETFLGDVGNILFEVIANDVAVDWLKKSKKAKDSRYLLMKSEFESNHEFQFSKMISEDENTVIGSIAGYLILFQIHDLLPVFAEARSKLFARYITHLVSRSHASINLTIASCIFPNTQLSPPTSVIYSLEKNKISEISQESLEKYLSDLTPSTLSKIIENLDTATTELFKKRVTQRKQDFVEIVKNITDSESIPNQLERIILELINLGYLDRQFKKINHTFNKINDTKARVQEEEIDPVGQLFPSTNGNDLSDEKPIRVLNDLLRIDKNDLQAITAGFIESFLPSDLVVTMLNDMDLPVKQRLVESLSNNNSSKVLDGLSVCEVCKHYTPLPFVMKDFREALMFIFGDKEIPFFCDLGIRSTENGCMNAESVSHLQSAFINHANKYLMENRKKILIG